MSQVSHSHTSYVLRSPPHLGQIEPSKDDVNDSLWDAKEWTLVEWVTFGTWIVDLHGDIVVCHRYLHVLSGGNFAMIG